MEEHESIDVVRAWEQMGARARLGGDDIFILDTGGEGTPILVLHGFPTCSFDWRAVVALLPERRIVAPDMLGYGLSGKPLDRPYSLFNQADLVESLARTSGIERCVLVTHDMGDSVGGELCARALEGTLSFEIDARVVTNGSIYMDLVQLSAGQQVLLALPDEPLPADRAITQELFIPGLAATFAEATKPTEGEMRAQWELLARAGGNRVLPRLIRYIEERRVHEDRWTGAIERHPSPLTIVWGDQDPIAVYAMAERLAERRADATLVRLEGVGHYPMVETPDRVARAVRDAIGLMGSIG
ncbi:MAG: alpha/beta fold hydrolase [Actinomycetota bacterium]